MFLALGPPPFLLLVVTLAQDGERLTILETQLIFVARFVREHSEHNALVHDSQLRLHTCNKTHIAIKIGIERFSDVAVTS